MKKVILTGATGFLGRKFIEEVSYKDIEIIAVVRNDKSDISHLIKLNNTRIIYCDLNNISNLATLVIDKDVDIFYHFAWAGTSGDNRSNVDIQLDNVRATCECIKVASKMGCKRFINAGSIVEYETIQQTLMDQSKPSLSNIYSIAKMTADFMAKTLAVNLNIDYINCIISNIYGPGEKSARFINTTIRKFISDESCSFTSGEQLYDFIYITDAVNAFYIIGEKGKCNTNYYIGNPKPKPLKDYIIEMRDVVNKDINLAFGEIPYCGAELNYSEIDLNKLNDEFNFQSKVDFKQGIQNTVEWVKMEYLESEEISNE